MFKTGLYLLFITFTQLIAILFSTHYLYHYDFRFSFSVLVEMPNMLKFIFLIEFVISIYLIKLGYEKEMQYYFNNNQ